MKTTTYACENCGKTCNVFTECFDLMYPPGSTTPKTCCKKCARQLGHKKRRVPKVCPACGKHFTLTLYHKDRRFCSPRCYGDYRRDHPEKYPSPLADPAIHAKAMETRESRGHNGSPRGKDSPHWKGGKIWWRGAEWFEIAAAIRERDGACVNCGMTNAECIAKFGSPLAAHHIVPYRETQDNSPENLVALCNTCHGYADHNPEKLNAPLLSHP